ncbi:MAG: MFS transporter [Alphaproteobacteria bacterium]|nr:MFS transporter [Alphaproteobacteria bacterium]
MRDLLEKWSPSWRRPEVLLFLMAASSTICFAVWQALLNNFSIERAAFTGVEMGILQSLREVPGFLSFTVVFLLLLMREQPLALISLLLLGVGTAITGFFPSIIGLFCTTVLMSVGFHYYEALQMSLTLQWVDKKHAPEILGRLISVKAAASIVTFGGVWLAFDFLKVDFAWVYLVGGGAAIALTLFCWAAYPSFPDQIVQNKKMILRSRYWLFYALTFMSGARRQIFIVFAGFLMVEKFGYSVSSIAVLYLVNAGINIWLAPLIGRLIGRVGERKALIFEYVGLVGVFTGYAFVENSTVAAGFYILDHMFFALAIALKTYFQKIADPADIASTAGVSFSISHIAAVVIPAAFGVLWLTSPAAVFLSGAAMAAVSLAMALNVPHNPSRGNEVVVGRSSETAPAE